MNNKIIPVILAASLTIVISGCARTHLARDFGVANVHNIDQQTVNPTAYSKDVQHTLSGEKAQKVIDGYNKEKPTTSTKTLLNNVSN